MSKPVKNLIIESLRDRYAGIDTALWIELVGADGLLTNELRRELRSNSMRLEVVKSSLFRRALHDAPLGGLGRELAGPAALVTGGDSIATMAKLIEKWQPKMPGLKLRGAAVEGSFLGEPHMKGLSKMPTRRDLQARVAAAVRAPGANLAAAINGPGGRIAACVKAIAEKLEKGETIAAVA